MTKKELRELINLVIREYTGTGDMASTGATSDDGNNMVSQRLGGGSFATDKEEKEYYTNQSKYGGDGGHYKKEPAFHNPNRGRFTKF